MPRDSYARYFHEDFFDSPDSASSSKHSNIDIPVIAKLRETENYNRVLNEIQVPITPEPSEVIKEQVQNCKKETLLFNKAPNFFETTFHLQKTFWALVLILALLPVFKSGLVSFISLSQNFIKNIELKKIKNKLSTDKENIEAKVKSYHSDSGMRRTIKEEIKVIEENEILIKITK